MPGAAQCIANVLIIQKRIEPASKKVVNKWAKDVLKESQDKYTPRDTGDLIASGYTAIEKDTATEFYVRIGYTKIYAFRQHETPWYHHPIGQWKYLSTPFLQRSPALIKELESAWRSVL